MSNGSRGSDSGINSVSNHLQPVRKPLTLTETKLVPKSLAKLIEKRMPAVFVRMMGRQVVREEKEEGQIQHV